MIGPGTGVRVYLACGVTDMRKSITGLSVLVQDHLLQKPSSGAVFAFRGRKGDRLKRNVSTIVRQPNREIKLGSGARGLAG
jgi:transposase